MTVVITEAFPGPKLSPSFNKSMTVYRSAFYKIEMVMRVLTLMSAESWSTDACKIFIFLRRFLIPVHK